MGRNTKAVKNFIESIPDSKLTALPKTSRTVQENTDFKLDMQGMTSDKPPKHNLQVQVNRHCSIASLKRVAPKSVTIAIVPVDGSTTASQIKEALIAKISI